MLRGETSPAYRLVQDVIAPDCLETIYSDNRMASVLPYYTDDEIADFPYRAIDAQADAYREVHSLDQYVAMLRAALIAAEAEQVLSVADALVAISDAEIRREFSDGDDGYQWVFRARSIAHSLLGDWDASLEEQLRAVAVADDDLSGTASQMLNLGWLHIQLGEPQQAIEALGRASGLSDYGETVKLAVMACAHAELGQRAQADALAAVLRADLDGSHLSPIVEALLCADQTEAAVDRIVGWLDDPRFRDNALSYLQRHWSRANRTAFMERMDEQREALRVHPDVTIAVLRYGHIYDWPWFDPEL